MDRRDFVKTKGHLKRLHSYTEHWGPSLQHIRAEFIILDADESQITALFSIYYIRRQAASKKPLFENILVSCVKMLLRS